MLVTVRKAEERTQAELEVESSYMDLFGVNSSQSQRSDGPQALLLADARRNRRGARTRWTTAAATMRSYSLKRTMRTTTMVEANEAAAAEGGGKRKKGFWLCRNT